MNIDILSYPRIHISLLDLSKNGYRIFGGIGFCIDSLPSKLRLSSTDNLDLSKLRSAGYSEIEICKISNQILEIAADRRFDRFICLKSINAPTRHSGLGTGTQLRLALIEALFISNNTLDREAVTRVSGRGGASGVGIQTYFDGGLVFDIGRSRNERHVEFLPSNASATIRELPYKFGHLLQVPWICGIFIPTDVPAIDTVREKKFFRKFTPAPDCDVYRAVYEATFGLFGGAACNDFYSFSSAIRQLQLLHWKRNEIGLHGDAVLKYMREITDLGASAVGMSSFGPCLYYFGSNSEEIAQTLSKKYPSALSICAPIRSSGRTVNVS